MKICIIGGGTTGWWAAGYLEKQFPDYDITLIESSDIPIIGVGESTLPQIAQFFEDMGMSEDEWMEKSNAQKKFGNIKSQWNKPGGDEFAFTFWFNDNNVFDKWKQQYDSGKVDKHNINDQLYHKGGWQATAYHLDAEKAGDIVKNNCKNVTHIIDTLDELPEGYDLYLDCTGFRRKFVKDNTEVTLEHHLVDKAWVCPFELQDSDVQGYTQSVARSNGWQFIIDLTNRIGTGYVFSSKHQTDEDALAEFNKVNAHRTPFMGKSPRLLKWNPSVLSNPWHDNVVAVGLSNGFIDPLESNALFMTQFSITTLVRCLQRGYGANTYNRAMRNVWNDNSTYIKHHYMLSDRTDTEFWKYYSKFDASKTVWKNYHKMGNKYTNLYPDAIWATLALYYDKLIHYKSK
jgi:hypothetical protein